MKCPEKISSVLILTTFNYTTPFQVTCVSNSNYVSTIVQKLSLILSTELVTNSDLNFTGTDSLNSTAGSHRMNINSLMLTVSLAVFSYVL